MGKNGKSWSVTALALVLAAVFAVSACAGEKPRIAFVTKVMNPYFKVMVAGAQAQCDKRGVEMLFSAAQDQTAVEQQIFIVQDMIAKQVDAICIAPIGSKELVPVLKEALDAGIPVINVDNRLDAATMKEAGIAVPYVGVDDEDSAYNVCKVLVKALDGKGDVAILEGIRGADNAQARKRGAEKAFAEAPGIKIVSSQTANWKAEEALNVFTNVLQANPGIRGVFCANDMMSFGAIQAIDAAGRKGKVLVVSIDAEDQAIENVKNGDALATVYQNQDAQAAKAIDMALDAIAGKPVALDVKVPTVVKTKADL